jgi:hypothetical protein
VDELVNIQKVGYREYQNFIKSMNDYKFKSNLIDKYRVELEIRNLKNYIIYVIQLQLSKEVNYSEYFTTEELQDMDISINPIPYFQRLYGNPKDNNESEYTPMKYEYFLTLESNVFDKLNERFGK